MVTVRRAALGEPVPERVRPRWNWLSSSMAISTKGRYCESLASMAFLLVNYP